MSLGCTHRAHVSLVGLCSYTGMVAQDSECLGAVKPKLQQADKL